MLQLKNLTVDYREAPLGVENTAPRFGWQAECDAANAQQTAYRICVTAAGWDAPLSSQAAGSAAGHTLRKGPRIPRAAAWGDPGRGTAQRTCG